MDEFVANKRSFASRLCFGCLEDEDEEEFGIPDVGTLVYIGEKLGVC